MNSVLLIGNGPNRLTEKGPSWTELLTELGNAFGGEEEPLDISTPFPLLYEQIFLRTVDAQMGREDSDPENSLKKKIAELFKRVEPNEVHRELMALPFRQINQDRESDEKPVTTRLDRATCWIPEAPIRQLAGLNRQ